MFRQHFLVVLVVSQWRRQHAEFCASCWPSLLLWNTIGMGRETNPVLEHMTSWWLLLKVSVCWSVSIIWLVWVTHCRYCLCPSSSFSCHLHFCPPVAYNLCNNMQTLSARTLANAFCSGTSYNKQAVQYTHMRRACTRSSLLFCAMQCDATENVKLVAKFIVTMSSVCPIFGFLVTVSHEFCWKLSSPDAIFYG